MSNYIISLIAADAAKFIKKEICIMLDLLIKNVSVLDGTGSLPYRANIGIKGGKITTITRSNGPEASTVIDGSRKILTPGFIDAHGHSDLDIFNDPGCEYKLRQGITTEICGQCGFTHAPVTKKGYPFVSGYYSYMKAFMPENFKEITFGQYLDNLEKLPLGINIGMLVGHGTLRLNVMGFKNCPPSHEEIEEMKALAEEVMQSGALGLSSGLMYAPGSYSDVAEISEICKVISKYDGVYGSHIRDQGKLLVESVEETIEVGRRSGVPVVISHHKATGKSNWGKVKQSVECINSANDDGFNVYHDVYPYLATSTTLNSTLPPSAGAQGPEKLLENLKDNEFKLKLYNQIFVPVEEWDNDLKETGYEGIMIIQAPGTPDAVGKTIAEYAKLKGIKPFDAYIELLVANKLEVMDVIFSLCEDDLETVMKDKRCMIGTDGLYKKGSAMTHPRAIGTFPRVLGHYVRDKGIISLPDAILKITSLPAQVYKLKGKGLIREGMDSDLVIFDANTIIDQADFISPFKANLGIDYVIVNGKISVDHDVITGTAAGKVIRKAQEV